MVKGYKIFLTLLASEHSGFKKSTSEIALEREDRRRALEEGAGETSETDLLNIGGRGGREGALPEDGDVS